MQLFLGVRLNHANRLKHNMGALIEGEDWASPEGQEEMNIIVEETLTEMGQGQIFDVLAELISKAAQRGYKIRFNIGLFIKSQITVGGIISELDPELNQDQYVMDRISDQVFKETPKRLLYTLWFPAWNSHSYPSQLSNEDVKDVQFQSWGRGLKAAGKAVWKGIRWPFEAIIP